METKFPGFSGIQMIDDGAADGAAIPLTAAPSAAAAEPGATESKVVIVGSGPAGLTAAIYAARANLEPIVIAGYVPGGQLMITSEVENYPGFPDGIQGPELMELFRKQAARFGTRFADVDLDRVDFSERPFHLRAGGGGGDTALEEAPFLTRFASQVTLVHRREQFRGSKIMQERALAHPKIDVRWNSEIAEVLGEDVVTGLRLRDARSGDLHDEPFDGLFVAIGYTPNTAVVRDWLPGGA